MTELDGRYGQEGTRERGGVGEVLLQHATLIVLALITGGLALAEVTGLLATFVHDIRIAA
jgi:hypothetical protein